MLAGNSAILAITVLIVLFCAERYRRTRSFIEYPVLVAIGLWLLAIGIPNFFLLLSPTTTLSGCTVLDQVSKKPVAGAQVIAEWKVASTVLQEKTSRTYKTYSTITDSRGEFSLPLGLKPLSFFLLPVYSRYFEGISVKIVDDDYFGEIQSRQNISHETVTLLPVTNADVSIKDLANYPRVLLSKGLDNFEKKFSLRQVQHEHALEALAHMYEMAGREQKAKAVNEEINRRRGE